MKKIYIVFCLLCIHYTGSAQTNVEIKEFAKKYFYHFKQGDLKWILAQYIDSTEMSSFLEKNSKDRIKKSLMPKAKRMYDRQRRTGRIKYEIDLIDEYERLEQCNTAQLNKIAFDSIYNKCKIYFQLNNKEYSLRMGDLVQNDSLQIVIRSSWMGVKNETFWREVEERRKKELETVVKKTVAKKDKYSYDGPKVIMEESATFPGGEQTMKAFINNNKRSLREVNLNKVDGELVVHFMVEKNGTLSNVEVKVGLGFGCDEEAIRIIKLMPPWKPAKLNGQIVREKKHLIIKFDSDL